MVNLDFDKFNKVQKKHEAHYLAGGAKNKPASENFDSADDLNRKKPPSVGAEGRDV
ncbi:MAG: hypothetical protein LPK26_23325 [Bacillaceae bacterium]|uniref:Uncharacterized protein n=1 Tax=Alkalihalobacterium chitinilyticum TaxID=2980103 RepID=A0ABT5VE50_9BACI|nr:hypothetical protein [Alkalihalobacterium chitinilyticum]MDE5413709.1 hypothetical protein [Alkalihalobacterium chitinilyticum]MEB1810195.1 hypothetical protein [Bacillaceae bacterium]